MKNGTMGMILSGALAVTFTWADASHAEDQARDRLKTQAQDQTRDPEQEQDFLRIRARVKKDTGMSDAQLSALDPQLRRYAARSRNEEALARTAREAHRACNQDQTCVGNMLGLQNRAMERGYTDEEASDAVCNLLREQEREREQKRTKMGPADVANDAQARFDKRLGEQQQAQDRARARLQKETGMSAGAAEALDPELRRYLRRSRNEEALVRTVRAGFDGCDKSPSCTASLLRLQNRAMERGFSDDEAGDLVQAAVREQVQERTQQRLQLSPGEFADRCEARFEQRLVERERVRLREGKESRVRGRGDGADVGRDRGREGERGGNSPAGSDSQSGSGKRGGRS